MDRTLAKESAEEYDVKMEDFGEETDETNSVNNNVDWVTVQQLVFNRVSLMFSTERIQKAVENTRKPNTNDWIRAAATKIASEWQQLVDAPLSHVFPLVALPEDLLKRIFNHYCCTRDMMALGLVSQQFRRCVNWNNKHYLTLDCSTPKSENTGENFKINGSIISVEKWPKLVEVLLDKTIITSFSAKFRKRPSISSALICFVDEAMNKCKKRPDRIQLEVVTKHGWMYGVHKFLTWCVEQSNVIFTNLRHLELVGVLFDKDMFAKGIKGKPLDWIELRNAHFGLPSPKNDYITEICSSLLSHTLHTLKIELYQHSLVEFIRDTPGDVISGLNTLEYVGDETEVEFERAGELVDLLWQRSPYLEYCKFGIICSVSPTPHQISVLIQKYFDSARRHSKTQNPVIIELCTRSRRWDDIYEHKIDSQSPLVLRPCQKTQIVTLLQNYDPETHIFDYQQSEEDIFDIQYRNKYTIKRGRFSLVIEQAACCKRKSFDECRKCASDPRLLLRNVYGRLDLARRRSVYTKKMVAWCLPLCQSNRLIEGLKKKCANVKMTYKQVKKSRRRFQIISLGNDYLKIECVPCENGICNICHCYF